jgi:hypothetical protein
VKTHPTGYWTFFCNPAKWQIDQFLSTNREDDDYRITEWQSDWFEPGQLGVVRVGVDGRSEQQLGGKRRLIPGIYGIVLVKGRSHEQATVDAFWLQPPPDAGERRAVDIRYLKNLLQRPLLLEVLRSDPAVTDQYLFKGFQAASMPLDPSTFQHVVELSGSGPELFENLEPESTETPEEIAALERKFANAAPEVKEAVSRRIERGPVAARVKAATGFKCQLCEAQGLNPIAFRKPSGEPYVEAHHVMFVSERTPGTLAPSNVITVCANHHRQLHYGNSELIRGSGAEFVFRIDGEVVTASNLLASAT